MDMTFSFPGGARVDGVVDGFVIRTDQPPDATAPSPFTLFLASIGACAGVYVQAFCRRRGIPTEDIRIVQRNIPDAEGMVGRVEVVVELPASFPEQYREAVVRAADRCAVKQHLLRPPEIVTESVSVGRVQQPQSQAVGSGA
jgi:ribosomal protein S12 methylthiotransferase accessory factor